jgi:hypothetical protein
VRRIEVDQRRLGERDERARGRVEENQRGEERREAAARRREERGEREPDPAGADERTPVADVAGDSDQRLDDVPDGDRDRDEESDLRVIEAEVAADERPRNGLRAERQLVEKLDDEQRRRVRSATAERSKCPGELTGGRHRTGSALRASLSHAPSSRNNAIMRTSNGSGLGSSEGIS